MYIHVCIYYIHRYIFDVCMYIHIDVHCMYIHIHEYNMYVCMFIHMCIYVCMDSSWLLWYGWFITLMLATRFGNL